MPSSFNNRHSKSHNNYNKMTNNNIERLPSNSSEDSSDSDTELLNNISRTREFPVRQRNFQRRLSLNNLNNLNSPKMAKAIDPFFEPKVLRKNNCITRAESVGSLVNESKKVLVIYTGGTIGMVKNDNGVYEPNAPNALSHALKKYPQLHDDVYYKRNFPMNESKHLLVLP